MSPELLLHGHASRASDVYAFGIVLWEMATGLRAFAGAPTAVLLLVLVPVRGAVCAASVSHPLPVRALAHGALLCCMRTPTDVPKWLLGAAVLRDRSRPAWPAAWHDAAAAAVAATRAGPQADAAAARDRAAASSAGSSGGPAAAEPAAAGLTPPLEYRQLAEACWAHEAQDRCGCARGHARAY
jgi:hypothetical protein